MKKKNKVLVTGGAGFIGSYVADELIKLGQEVIVLDDLSGGFKRNVNPKAKFVKGSINDVKLINKLFKENKFDYVFHLAAYAAEGLSHFIKHYNYQNNLVGSVNLINASVNHNVKCFVFTSSIAVYGPGQVPMIEEMIPEPEDSYGIAKYAVEMELRVSQEMFGLNHIIFRPHNVYGSRQNLSDKYRNVVGIFINQIMQNLPITIFGDGKQKRAFTHIKDISSVIAESIFKPKAYNQVFNIGTDQAVTVNRLADLVFKAMGKKTRINHLLERSEVKYAYSDHKRVKNILNYQDKINLEQGIEEMTQWAKEVEVKQIKPFANIEILKNLPPSWLKFK
ncbi:MAG: NAD-dependent epimerase/dehydratase family protein [Patescibacteria group bacterium]|nr:NAD-dependent epimerase/dehydratase family protein [Patescibacteria group bacterium]MBU2472892.1 NAD-dependent epimerase/dehydratase family protein [Patescibacteria group bacterium]